MGYTKCGLFISEADDDGILDIMASLNIISDKKQCIKSGVTADLIDEQEIGISIQNGWGSCTCRSLFG